MVLKIHIWERNSFQLHIHVYWKTYTCSLVTNARFTHMIQMKLSSQMWTHDWLETWVYFKPRFLAKYTCARFHASHPQLVPDPVGLLSHQDITEVLIMVQVMAPPNNHRSAGKQRPGTIAPFNVLAIRHPAVAGQVLYYPVSESCVSNSI